MKYFNVTIQVKPDKAEEAESLLFSIGAESVSASGTAKKTILKALFSEERLSDAQKDQQIFALDPCTEELPETEWVDEWIKYYEPVYLEDEFIIIPDDYSGELKDSDAIHLTINPRGAFGSGTHPTTLMCLKEIKRVLSEKKKSSSGKISVVDIGTGSGILAIAAEKCGADSIDAYDIEQKSVDKTLENAELNNCSSINVHLSSVEDNGDEKKYSIVIANLQSCIIESNIDTITGSAADDGVIILSGIYQKWTENIKKILAERNCSILKTETMDDWVCIVAIKN